MPFNQLRVCLHGLVAYVNMHAHLVFALFTCLDGPGLRAGWESWLEPYDSQTRESLHFHIVAQIESQELSTSCVTLTIEQQLPLNDLNSLIGQICLLLNSGVEFGSGDFVILQVTLPII